MNKKSLGQYWLFDQPSLKKIVGAGGISRTDTILEIGSGPGSLTQLLAKAAGNVIAVEKDEELAKALTRQKLPNLKVVNQDILEFDLTELPKGYKVIANIPYYLTSNLLRILLESSNPPLLMSLLVQREVAERITAGPGNMSVLAFSVQYFGQPKLIGEVKKELFKPVPKVDSAIVQIKLRAKPYFEANTKKLFRLIKAGFSNKRKMLKNSLAGGLKLPIKQVDQVIISAGLSPAMRAQELSLGRWQKLYRQFIIDKLL